MGTKPNTISKFEELLAWQQGHELALATYQLTKKFPAEEKFGITSQLRRAASSITANIAEGFARYHFNDKIRFYYQARGSNAEVQNFLLLARDLGYIDAKTCNEEHLKAEQVRKLINGMIRSIEE